MKNLILLASIASFLVIKSQSIDGYHFQRNGGITNTNCHFQLSKDTFCVLNSINSVSSYSYNCVAITNANNGENYGYHVLQNNVPYETTFTATPFPTEGTKLIMKNKNEGVIFSPFSQFYYTSTDGFVTMTNYTPTILPNNATKYGYYSITGAPSNYKVMFSVNGLTWNNSLSTNTNSLSVTKAQQKLYATAGNTVYASTNGGASFSVLTNTVDLTDASLFAATDDTLYVIGTNKLLKSFDAGNSWLSVTPPTSTYFLSAGFKNGHELLLFYGTSNFNKSTYYSSDASTTFSLTNFAPPMGINGKVIASSTYFFSDNTLLKTTNGINNGSVNQWDNYISRISEKGYDVDFNGTTGIIGYDDGYCAVSNSNGTHFSKYSKPDVEDLMAVKVVNNNLFFIGNRKGEVYKSINQGTTWTKQYSNSLNFYAIKILASQNTNTIVMQRAGQPIISTDGGNTFNLSSQTIGGSISAMSIKPVSGQILFLQSTVSGSTFSIECSSLSLTTKNSISSYTINTTDNIALIDMQMANDNVGYIIANNNTQKTTIILKTTNGCNSFTQVGLIPNAIAHNNLQIKGTDTLYILGKGSDNKASFYHYSIDGGVNWTKINLDFSKPGYSNDNENNAYKTHFFSPNQYIALVNGISGGFPTENAYNIYLKLSGVANPLPNSVNEEMQYSNRDNFKIYPNPTKNSLTIEPKEFQNSDKFTITIVNVLGEIVLHKQSASVIETLELNNFKSGVYFIEIIQNAKRHSAKFIKE